MILLLKIHASCKIFDKICLKAIRDTFFPNMWFVIKGQGTQFFCGCDIQQKDTPQIPFLKGTSWSPHKENPEEGAWYAYCNDFEQNEWECFLSNQSTEGYLPISR